YPRWRDSFRWLFRRHNVEPRIVGIYPETFDELQAMENGVAGSPQTVRAVIAAEREQTATNYFVSWLAFGDMTPDEALRSTELFTKEVMPAFEDSNCHSRAGGNP